MGNWQCENCGKNFKSDEQQNAGSCYCPKCKANIGKYAVEDEKRRKERAQYVESKEYRASQEKDQQELKRRQG
jgi:predicted  nucleic acid-binding Zn-ribbon protein